MTDICVIMINLYQLNSPKVLSLQTSIIFLLGHFPQTFFRLAGAEDEIIGLQLAQV